MSIKNIFITISLFLLLGSCFDDDGNYKYDKIIEPEFLFGEDTDITGIMGENIKFESKFSFEEGVDTDNDYSYEWRIGDVVLSREKDLDIPTADVVEAIKLEVFSEHTIWGSFRLVNKKTGVEHIQKLKFYLKPEFWKGAWFILSEDGANSKLSYQYKKDITDAEGVAEKKHINIIGVFRDKNDGKILEGKPISLMDYKAPHISPAVGATTVFTENGGYDVNNESFVFYKRLKDQFLNGEPQNFNPIKGFNIYNKTILINEDGKVFIRKFSENYLGNKYINEPYTIDGQDAKISLFAEVSLITSSRCILYDKQNNRLVCYLIYDDRLTNMELIDGDHPLNVLNLPDDVEVLKLSSGVPQPIYSGGGWELMVYKKGSEYFVYEFKSVSGNPVKIAHKDAHTYKLPNTLKANSKIIIINDHYYSGSYKNSIFYSIDNKLYCFDRYSKTSKVLYTFDSNISALKINDYYFEYSTVFKEIAVGLENGDFMKLDISDSNAAKIVDGSKFNAGGKVVDITIVGGGKF